MKRLLYIFTCILTFLALVVGTGSTVYAHPFKDVGKEWYTDGIDFCYENELMNGTTETMFKPNDPMSRAMLVTVLYRIEGSPDVAIEHPFLDFDPGSWFDAPVSWAYQNSIVNGFSEYAFAPGHNITRQQMVVIFYRYASSEGYDVSGQADLSGYMDASEVADYAHDAFEWAVSVGIISGVSATELVPNGSATRAQCATIIKRFVEWAGILEEDPSAEPTVPEESESTEPSETVEPTDPEVPHEHSYTCEVSVPVTCDADGLNTYSCDCGDSYDEVIPGGHDWGMWLDVKIPSIVEEGVHGRHCLRCAIWVEEAVPMLPADTDVSFDYETAMAVGNAYAQEKYGWTPDLTMDETNSGFYPASTYTVSFYEVRGQAYLNEHVCNKVDALYLNFVRSDTPTEGFEIRCHVFEKDDYVHIRVYYG